MEGKHDCCQFTKARETTAPGPEKKIVPTALVFFWGGSSNWICLSPLNQPFCSQTIGLSHMQLGRRLHCHSLYTCKLRASWVRSSGNTKSIVQFIGHKWKCVASPPLAYRYSLWHGFKERATHSKRNILFLHSLFTWHHCVLKWRIHNLHTGKWVW